VAAEEVIMRMSFAVSRAQAVEAQAKQAETGPAPVAAAASARRAVKREARSPDRR